MEVISLATCVCLQQGGGTSRCIVGVKCTQYGQLNFGTSPKSKLNTFVICLKIQFAALSMSVLKLRNSMQQ